MNESQVSQKTKVNLDWDLKRLLTDKCGFGVFKQNSNTYILHKTDFKLLAAIWNLTQIKSNNRNTGNDDDDINNFEHIIDKLSRWFRLYRYLLGVVIVD